MIGLKLKLAAALLTMLVCMSQCSLHPIVILPGNGGNQLEARLTTAYKPSSLLCGRWYPVVKNRDGWYRLWFEPSVLLPPFTKCFAERMTLYYDPELDDYSNAPGVETRVPYFGSTESLTYLDPYLKQATVYMAPLVNSLEQIGYVNEETLFGAPYDFRYGLAAEGHPSKVGSKYLDDLKTLIETASKMNSGRPVILLSHSLGGLFALQLLNRNSPEWRRQFIKHLVALSTPWAGTVLEMLTFASGSTLGIPLVNPLLVRDEQRSSESNLWLMPSPATFNYTPIVITPNKTYTSRDIPQFLIDIGYSEGVYPYETRIRPLVQQMVAPNVPVTCVIGAGIETPEMLFYRDDKGFDEQPEIVYGEGDGSVNMVSLLALEGMWASEKGQDVKVVKVNGVSHTSILKDDKSISEIIGEISMINSPVRSDVM